MKENLLTEKEMVFLVLLYFHACKYIRFELIFRKSKGNCLW